MKNIIALIFIGLMIMSCGSTTEAEVQKPVVGEGLPERQTSGERPQKRPGGMDPEQLVAQLGLSEEKEIEFLAMWNSTGEAMRNARRELGGGDRKVLIAAMQEIKKEREAGLERILTDGQLAHYFEIVAKNRSKIGARKRKSKGN